VLQRFAEIGPVTVEVRAASPARAAEVA